MKAHNYTVPILITLLFACLPGRAEPGTIVLDFEITPPAGKLSVAEIPKKPRSFVVDEPAQFSTAQKSELEISLARMNLVPTYVINKKGRLPVSADLYANELLRRWTSNRARFSAMVLSINTSEPEIFVIIAGRNIDPITKNDLLTLGNSAIKLINGKPDQLEKLQIIATALAPALNTFAEIYQEQGTNPGPVAASENLFPELTAHATRSGRQPFPQVHSPKTTSQWDLLSATLDWQLIRILFIIICAIISLIVITLLFRRVRLHRPLYFPLHKPRHRFSAPYSGGSNAQIKYGSE